MGCIMTHTQRVVPVDDKDPEPIVPPMPNEKIPRVDVQSSSSDDEQEAEPSEAGNLPPMPPPKAYMARRRSSVSAESPASFSFTSERVVIAKSDETRQRLFNAVRHNLLFANLTEDALSEVLDAMFEEEVEEGNVLIRQGDREGKYFYVVGEGGAFDIYVNDVKVVTIKAGGSFGELALMYNSPRAATVIAGKRSIVYGLDRLTFKRTLMMNFNKKRELYLKFLRSIPLLGNLEENELAKLADALHPMRFADGEYIVRQGEPGEVFYVLEQGTLSVRQRKPGRDDDVELSVLQSGAYFGEIALLNDAPRVATVVALGDCKVLMVDRASFTRLLGPCQDVMRRGISEYDTYDMALERRRMQDSVSFRRTESNVGRLLDIRAASPT